MMKIVADDKFTDTVQIASKYVEVSSVISKLDAFDLLKFGSMMQR